MPIAGHHDAAFVKQGQRILHRAAIAATRVFTPCGDMAAVDRRLGVRKGQPDQRVKQIMNIVRAGRHDAAGEDLCFIAQGGGIDVLGRKPNGVAAGVDNRLRALLRELIERVDFGH